MESVWLGSPVNPTRPLPSARSSRKWSTPPVNGSLELMTTSYLGQKNYGLPENPPLRSVFSGFPRVPNHLCRRIWHLTPLYQGTTERPVRGKGCPPATSHLWLGSGPEVSLIFNMAMDQYLLIPFLVGWTSIYQLFWCSPGVQGFDTLPYGYLSNAFYLDEL